MYVFKISWGGYGIIYNHWHWQSCLDPTSWKHHSSWWPIAIILFTCRLPRNFPGKTLEIVESQNSSYLTKFDSAISEMGWIYKPKVSNLNSPHLFLVTASVNKGTNPLTYTLMKGWRRPQNSHVVEVATQLQLVVAVIGGIGRCIHCCNTLRYLASEKGTHSSAFSQRTKGDTCIYRWFLFAYMT